jgi:hypothetical protein
MYEAAEGKAGDGLRQLAVHVRDRLENALAAVALRIAVAQLEGFARARRRPRRNGGLAADAAGRGDLDADGRIPTRIQNLLCPDSRNRHVRHQSCLLSFVSESEVVARSASRLTARVGGRRSRRPRS